MVTGEKKPPPAGRRQTARQPTNLIGVASRYLDSPVLTPSRLPYVCYSTAVRTPRTRLSPRARRRRPKRGVREVRLLLP